VKLTDRFDFATAISALAVANTPLFLLQKLQENPLVHAIATQLTAEEMLDELKKSVQQKPETLEEAVIPYVLLVAISLNLQAAYLRKTLSIDPAYDDDWYKFIRSALLQTYQPTSRQFFEFRQRPSFSTTSSAATQTFPISPKTVVPQGN
jgi:hypothetical protein